MSKSKVTYHSVLMYAICATMTAGLIYSVYKKYCPKWLLPMFGKYCNKQLEEKFEESLKQGQTLSTKLVVVK